MHNKAACKREEGENMEITIKGEPKEIADFVRDIQRRQEVREGFVEDLAQNIQLFAERNNPCFG